MSYGRTTYRSRRRLRVRTPITLLLLVALLVAAAWYGVKQLRMPDTTTAVVATVCTPQPVVSATPGARVSAADVTVNVYNAGQIAGLADRTAVVLKQRGFTIGAVDNDPTDSNYKGFVLVRAAARNLPGVNLVLAQEKGSVFQKITNPVRTDDTVDMILGARFRALLTPAPTSIPLVSTEATFPASCSSD
jgi:hypothetical protein